MSTLTTFGLAFLQPPGINILLCLFGLYCWVRSCRFLMIFWFFVSAALLYAFSIPFVNNKLLAQLENQYPVLKVEELNNQKESTAIVVLSSSVWPNGIVRCQYVAQLIKDKKLPILVSGGNKQSDSDDSAEANILAKLLVNTFNVTEKIWIESDSHNTLENAKFSKKILEENSIKKVFLVTNAWHMPRAVDAFKSNGIEVIPAPIKSDISNFKDPLKQFIPSPLGIVQSAYFIHEYLGSWWYKALNKMNMNK